MSATKTVSQNGKAKLDAVAAKVVAHAEARSGAQGESRF